MQRAKSLIESFKNCRDNAKRELLMLQKDLGKEGKKMVEPALTLIKDCE